ncbi:hypothetical protein PCC8801_0179 [Rippkaea orientalis PCC 8801]|uniref:Uncharacterized protein n=1 Tax=Rippkaea orientalis (strain PCC 8801 / RF-1) TaxID=41431 RepID=B7K1X6_RIPO1|nr:hypothetical protein [Rippkaea orientalis]ACK64283.1 hypothetical protein PCC8801_0179 [Rippkaea orientalis PCC 8801]
MKTYLSFVLTNLLFIVSLADSKPMLANTRENNAYIKQLENTVYYLPNGQIISLLNGSFQAQEVSFVLQKEKAIGDLNGDRIEDAVVVLSSFKQGIQSGNYLAVFITNQEKKLNNIDTLTLEDKMKIEFLKINSQQLTLNFLAYSPHDPDCCPSQKKQLKYGFDPLAKVLIPLAFQSQNEVQDSLRINRRLRNTDENNEVQIKF